MTDTQETKPQYVLEYYCDVQQDIRGYAILKFTDGIFDEKQEVRKFTQISFGPTAMGAWAEAKKTEGTDKIMLTVLDDTVIDYLWLDELKRQSREIEQKNHEKSTPPPKDAKEAVADIVQSLQQPHVTGKVETPKRRMGRPKGAKDKAPRKTRAKKKNDR